MSVLIEEITERVLALPISDRAILADRLFESLEDHRDNSSVREAWMTEVRRRVADIKSGKANLIDGDIGLAQVRALIQK